MTKMGVENIKTVLSFVFLAVARFRDIDADLDGNTEFAEILGVITTLAVKFPGVFRAIPQLDDEWNDLTDDEIREVVQYFKDEFDLPNDSVEQTIEHTVEAVAEIYSIVREIAA